MAKNTDGIIFDLDGTLWDASETVAQAWQAAKAQVDFEIRTITPDDIRLVAGMHHETIYRKWFPELSEEQIQALMEVCMKEKDERLNKSGGILYEELEPTLEYLHQKYKLFIVSNCQNGYIEAFLKHHNLHKYFDDHECSGRTGRSKGENIRDVVERNHLKAPVYIGDTQGDYDASVEAEVPFIYAKYGFRDVEGYDTKVDRFSELRQIF